MPPGDRALQPVRGRRAHAPRLPRSTGRVGSPSRPVVLRLRQACRGRSRFVKRAGRGRAAHYRSRPTITADPSSHSHQSVTGRSVFEYPPARGSRAGLPASDRAQAKRLVDRFPGNRGFLLTLAEPSEAWGSCCGEQPKTQQRRRACLPQRLESSGCIGVRTTGCRGSPSSPGQRPGRSGPLASEPSRDDEAQIQLQSSIERTST